MTLLEVETSQQIGCPAERVFAAVAAPAQIAARFAAPGSAEPTIEDHAAEPDRGLSFRWNASGVPTRVRLALAPNAANNVTEVTVREQGWQADAEGIARYGEQLAGWVRMLLCLKAYLEYERIDLRATPSRARGSSFELHLERQMRASPAAIYHAWTEQWDRWFAEPGTLSMRPTPGAPFAFEAVDEAGVRYPHYGRFLRLEPGEARSLIAHTWVTGATRGEETRITVKLEPVDRAPDDLAPAGRGTRLRLSHTGFYDEAARDRHEVAWPEVLAYLDDCLAGPQASGRAR